MDFVNRHTELRQLEGLISRKDSSLAVVWGRRRVGKSRLLAEWVGRHDGLYFMADESSAVLQRRYLATVLARRFAGFRNVLFADWASLFDHLSTQLAAHPWRGPLVIDELPYLALCAPEIGSVLQRFVDQQSRTSNLVLAVAGSSQQMMNGLVIDATAPLFGRARALIHLRPISPAYIGDALKLKTARQQVEIYSLLGGIPQYWDVFGNMAGEAADVIEALALNPDGVLHNEPERLLREETPSAMGLRPLLDAIGLGAHRLSEIAARLSLPASSLARPLQRLQELDLVARETPFGSPEKGGKKALYRISDPFFSWWFRVVAPNRGGFITMSVASRRALLLQEWASMCAEVWEQLCRLALPGILMGLNDSATYLPAKRYWQGNEPEWDAVCVSFDKKRAVLGEAKWKKRPCSREFVQNEARRLKLRRPPINLAADRTHQVLFVPEIPKGCPTVLDGVAIFDAAAVLQALR
jgi:AAA+ ATPase superfamily predicted ATPase